MNLKFYFVAVLSRLTRTANFGERKFWICRPDQIYLIWISIKNFLQTKMRIINYFYVILLYQRKKIKIFAFKKTILFFLKIFLN